MKRFAVLLGLAALAFPALASAATPARGSTKGQIIGAWAAQDSLHISHHQEQRCFRAQTLHGWAAATVGNPQGGTATLPPLCGIKVDTSSGLQDWQPDVAMFHHTSRGWRFVWEFDETTAGEAAQHGVPRWAYNGLVNRQLFL